MYTTRPPRKKVSTRTTTPLFAARSGAPRAPRKATPRWRLVTWPLKVRPLPKPLLSSGVGEGESHERARQWTRGCDREVRLLTAQLSGGDEHERTGGEQASRDHSEHPGGVVPGIEGQRHQIRSHVSRRAASDAGSRK